GSTAQKAAADEQAKAAQEALDFEKQTYAATLKRLAPYIQGGTTASDRMTQLLGLPSRAGTTATAPPTYGPPVGSYQAQSNTPPQWQPMAGITPPAGPAPGPTRPPPPPP